MGFQPDRNQTTALAGIRAGGNNLCAFPDTPCGDIPVAGAEAGLHKAIRPLTVAGAALVGQWLATTTDFQLPV